MRFHKYQGLGNDYIVVAPGDLAESDLPELARAVCDRHFGVGSDGILVEEAAPDMTAGRQTPLRGAPPQAGARFALRIFNPDGSEAEKSGNGLRIFSRYLWDAGRVGEDVFTVETRGGTVRCQVRDAGRAVFVEMGTASFDSGLIPVTGPRREVVAEEVEASGERLRITGVTMGNPHCVAHVDELSEGLARHLGPALETHPLFPTRTNVQFVKVLDRRSIAIEIWERGAGYTLASGSSSCAAVAASVRLGLCSPGDVTVDMPGGTLQIGVDEDYAMTMLGPVGKVADGIVADEALRAAERAGETNR
jgi:diaminopimelate epimerase